MFFYTKHSFFFPIFFSFSFHMHSVYISHYFWVAVVTTFHCNLINLLRSLSPPTSFCSSTMTIRPTLLFSGTPAGWKTFPLLVPASLTLYIVKFWFDITLMFWGLVNLSLHNHQYFYRGNISRKITNQGLRSQPDHEAWLPHVNGKPKLSLLLLLLLLLLFHFLWICWRKWISKIWSFIPHHKISKSNSIKVTTHYWSKGLRSMKKCSDIFTLHEFFNFIFFRICSTPIISNYVILLTLEPKPSNEFLLICTIKNYYTCPVLNLS